MYATDDHLTRAGEELGEPDALYRVSPGWFQTKLAIGLGLVVLGVAGNWWWWVQGPGNMNFFFTHLLFWPPMVGIGLLVHMFLQRRLYVLIYPTGLLRLRRGEVDSFPWAEVREVRIKTQRTDSPVVERDANGTPVAAWLPIEAPDIQVWTAWLTIVRADGATAHMGPVLTDFERLTQTIQCKTFPRLWADAWGRFRAGEMVSFGSLEINLLGMHQAGKVLRWAELKEVAIAQGKLSVKQTGRWLPWGELKDINDVPNPHILLTLIIEAQALATQLAALPDDPGPEDE